MMLHAELIRHIVAIALSYAFFLRHMLMPPLFSYATMPYAMPTMLLRRHTPFTRPPDIFPLLKMVAVVSSPYIVFLLRSRQLFTYAIARRH